MRLSIDPLNLNYFETLASKTRLLVVQLLARQDMNVKELSEALGVSSSIMTKHVRKLESAGIITTRYVTREGSRQKMCVLLSQRTELVVPTVAMNREMGRKKVHELSIPVGQFTDLNVSPPCGLASETQSLGDLDTPMHMLAPHRMEAQLLWFGKGYVEYTLPNYLRESQQLTDIEIMGEFSSEAPGYDDNWPSDITVVLNGMEVCTFSTPGDFGAPRGTYTPDWWTNNQFGILVVIRIDRDGVRVNGERKNDISIDRFAGNASRWVLRFEAVSRSKGGGFTVFGKKFGNYAHDILFRSYYES